MKTALLFPGYGSQHVGMIKDIYDESRIVQEYFEEASNCLSINFVRLCFASSESELNRIDNALLSVFLVSTALYALLKERGIVADVVAGFDTGEYAALHAAQGLSLPDGLYFLNKYASFYADFVMHHDVEMLMIEGVSALSLKKHREKVRQEGAEVDIAISYHEKKHYISGTKSGLALFKKELPEHAVVLHEQWELGLHSALMEPVAKVMKDYLEKVDVKDLSVPLIGGTDGALLTQGNRLKERLIANMVTPIMWGKVLKKLDTVDRVICVGPGATLGGLVSLTYPEKEVISFSTLGDGTFLDQEHKDGQQ